MDHKNQVHLFYSKLPNEYTPIDVKNEIRNLEIEKIKNTDVKKEKTYAWLLLLYAIKQVYGYEHYEVDFEKLESGKWICDKCHFSISHRRDYVAIVVSSNNVGVDIEKNKIPIKNFLSKIANDNEVKLYDNSKAIELWTKKESLFKLVGEKLFSLKKLNTEEYCFETIYVDDYIISIATDDKVDVKVHEVINQKDVLC